MLLQSEEGRIRVFPACANHWREIRFNNLRCEGRVEFSSLRSNGRTLEIRLESASGDQVRLVNRFNSFCGCINRREIQSTDNGEFATNLAAGGGRRS